MPNYTISGLIAGPILCQFEVFGSNNHRYAWGSGERYNSESLQSSAKRSGASDVQDLVKIDRIMNTEHMQHQILIHRAISSANHVTGNDFMSLWYRFTT